MDVLLLATGALLLYFTACLYLHLSSPLRSMPGPFLARFTRLWYAYHAYRGHFEQDLRALHSRHGKIVRIAPHEYSIDDPEAVKIIYGRGSQFRKANFYAASERPGHPNLFSQRNIVQHDRDRKKYNFAYTMTAMVSYEKYVDDCIELLSARLSELSKERKEKIDMAWWLHCFAFDVIGAITFSKRFGFLDEGKDVHGLIETVHENAFYATIFGIYNELFPLLSQVKRWLAKLGILKASGQAFMQSFAGGLLQGRQQQLQAVDSGKLSPEIDDGRPKDFLTKYMEQHIKGSNRFGIGDVMNGLGANINAGSDTASITLSAVLYHLHKNTDVLAKLRRELSAYEHAGELSTPATFKEAQSMPYLQAVIKETLRIHPAVGITLPRVVPVGGAQIAGQFFPPGAVVGINPYVAHRNQAVFGLDADDFRPERWMKKNTDVESLAVMERYFMAFGMGNRSCIGRNVAMLEITKCVPELLRRFEFDLGGQLVKQEWQTKNWLFIMPKTLDMTIRERYT